MDRMVLFSLLYNFLWILCLWWVIIGYEYLLDHLFVLYEYMIACRFICICFFPFFDSMLLYDSWFFVCLKIRVFDFFNFLLLQFLLFQFLLSIVSRKEENTWSFKTKIVIQIIHLNIPFFSTDKIHGNHNVDLRKKKIGNITN